MATAEERKRSRPQSLKGIHESRASADWRFAPAPSSRMCGRVSRSRRLSIGRKAIPLVCARSGPHWIGAYPDEVRVILTQRTAALRVLRPDRLSRRQIDAHDKNAAAAALREAHEEIGLDPRHVEPLGYLDPLRLEPAFALSPWWPKSRRQSPSDQSRRGGRSLQCFRLSDGLGNHALHIRRSTENCGISMRCLWCAEYLGSDRGILRNLYERLYC